MLGPKAREFIEDEQNDVLFSIVSLWELMIKTRTGKLDLDHRRLAIRASQVGFTLIAVELAHLDRLARLSKHHGDPFDHLLIAQAQAEDAAFVSDDSKAARYPMEVIAARR
jgi:PIN domain nuclease of toxin-antitoxin system